MYAVVKTSGRQYRVSPGDVISVEKLEGAPGSKLDIKEVLLIGGDDTLVGSPFVDGAKVSFVIEQQYRGPKVRVFKKKRRKNYRRTKGHRSELTKLFVTEIASPKGAVKADSKPHIIDPAKPAKKIVKKAKTKKEKKAEAVEKKAAPKKRAAAPKKKSAAKKKAAGAKKAVKKKAPAKKAKK